MLSREPGPHGGGKKILRLAAWQWLHGGKPGESYKPFDCERDCGELGSNVGLRALRGCTRADLDDVEWHVSAEHLGFYLGRARADGDEFPAEPVEDGCPAGYARARLFGALNRFYRQPDQQGGRVANPHFDRCDDPLILDAILYLEQEEARARSEWMRADVEARRQEASHG